MREGETMGSSDSNDKLFIWLSNDNDDDDDDDGDDDDSAAAIDCCGWLFLVLSEVHMT